MVADPAGGFNPYGQQQPGGPYGAPPGAPAGFGGPPAAQGGFGAPPAAPGGYGAPPPGGFGPPPGGQPAGGFPPPGGGFGSPPQQGYGPPPGGAPQAYGQSPQGGFGTPQAYGSPTPGYAPPAAGGAMVAAGGARGPIGKTRNPVMVLLIGMLCFVYALIEGAAMLKELKAFRGKDDISLITFIIPILNLIALWKLPAKVLEAKQMAGVPNPQVPHPILYLFLWTYFLPSDLNEAWQAAGGGQPR
jgi:hypothetical protein